MKQVSIVVGLALVTGMFGVTACAPKQKVVCAMPPMIGAVPQGKREQPKNKPAKTVKEEDRPLCGIPPEPAPE